MKRFGTSYSGFFYPPELRGLSSTSIVYCFGAGEDIGHDIEIARKTGATVHIFDPTPRACAHVEKVKEALTLAVVDTSSEYWELITKEPHVSADKVVLHQWGLFTRNEPAMKFYMPTNKDHVSCSLLHGMKGEEFLEVPVKTLQTTMLDLGHTTVDLLKIDIEGVECDVLDQMLRAKIKPKYLSVDFDLGWTGERLRDRGKVRETVGKLLHAGYRILHRDEPNISFVLA